MEVESVHSDGPVEIVVPSEPVSAEPSKEAEVAEVAEMEDHSESSASEYSDADDIESDSEPTAALPPQPEDPQMLVRRSVRERVTPGKYREFDMSCSILPHSYSQPPQLPSGSLHRDEKDAEPQTFQEAISRDDSCQWKDAMIAEYQALLKNQTWELTDLPEERKALRCKWVYKVKTHSDGSVERFKARLVIKGFSQIKGVDYNETYSPVVRYASIRYLMSLASRMDLKIHQMDAVTAFLQGDLGEEEIYMEQPEGFVDPSTPRKVCKLKKALYGLKQASRVWNQKLDTELRRIGLKRSKYDTCVYFRVEGQTILIVAVYVDDLLVFSNNQRWVDQLKKQLTTKFLMKDLGLASKVLGIRVTRATDTVMLDQEQYVDQLLKQFGVDASNSVSTPADHNQKLTKEMSPKSEEERKQMQKVPFRELVGSLQFIAQCTRPDISYAVNAVSQFSNDPGTAHWTAAKRILRYLKGTKGMKLVYRKQADERFIGFSDADWGNDPETRRSITGYVFMQSGGPISWNCRKQSTVALSTTEAEYMAVSAATQEAIWWKGLRQELSGRIEPVIIFCDNKSAIHLAEKEVGYSPRSKHIDIRHHFVRELVEEKKIKLEHIGTQLQTADVMTKSVPVSRFEDQRKALGIE